MAGETNQPCARLFSVDLLGQLSFVTENVHELPRSGVFFL